MTMTYDTYLQGVYELVQPLLLALHIEGIGYKCISVLVY
jgi:hypothetical protein